MAYNEVYRDTRREKRMSTTATVSHQRERLVFVSSMAAGGEGAIYVFRLFLDSGQLVAVNRIGGLDGPFFLLACSTKRCLYSTHAPGKFSGTKENYIAAYRVDATAGELTLLNRQSSLGRGSCYLHMDSSSETLLVANYYSGSIVPLTLRHDGTLCEASSLVRHGGAVSGTKPRNQAQTHCIVLSPNNRFAVAAELGSDRIQSYRFQAEPSTLFPNDPAGADMNPGCGPRHVVFHPDGRTLYVICENSSAVAVFDHNSQTGTLRLQQTIATLADGASCENYAADLTIAPHGRFLYAGNRGHDSIAIYRIGENGDLRHQAIASSGGAAPHKFAITACGRLLLSANMAGDCVAVFHIHPATGGLSLTTSPAEVPSPSCVAIY